MRIYFSGIGGVGLGPLAEIAASAGYEVCGSDRETSLMTQQLVAAGIALSCDQSGKYLRQKHTDRPIDWFVYTAALPDDHPELQAARELGIKFSKRDELLAHIILEKDLRLVAVAGTHGKTTTTGMLVWALKQLGVSASYSVGSTLSFGPSGYFNPKSRLFIYECDEFDRNFLQFHPSLSLITAVEYDHPDTYSTETEYRTAFAQFGAQSQRIITWSRYKTLFSHDHTTFLDIADPALTLPGEHNRQNASLVLAALKQLSYPASPLIMDRPTTAALLAAIHSFPGTGRRFEKLADNLYSDYGHHPTEIAATLQLARELADHIVLVYQPHQNIRQHEIQHLYTDMAFSGADEIYWLPTYLTREDPKLSVLTPTDLTGQLDQKRLHLANMDDTLWRAIERARASGALVLCMGAGTIDSWVRQKLSLLSGV